MTEHHTSSKKRGKAAGKKDEDKSVHKKCGRHLNAKNDNSGENSGESKFDNLQKVQAEVHAEDVESNGEKSSSAGNEEHVTGDSKDCSDDTGENHDSNDSQSPIKGKEHASIDCSNGSAVNHTGESMSVISDMSFPTLADSVNNLNATDENNEKGDVNESKDGSGREVVKKEPRESGKKSTPSRSKKHDSVKSVQESTSPLGTAKEHAKNAVDNG